MNTSAPTMTFDREGRKLTGSPKWPRASKGESILGTSDQFIPLRMTIGEVSSRGRNIPPRLRGSIRAILGLQLQGAEAPGASEEGLGISPEKFIAYSVVRTRATLPGCAMSPSRNKGDSWSWSPTEPAEASYAYCFVPLTVYSRVCG
jgi:hypothetical protein